MPARRPPIRIGSTDVARPEDMPAKARGDAMPPGLGLSEILRETRNNPGKLVQLADEVRGHVRYGPPTPDDVDHARRTIEDALQRRELLAFGRHSLRRRGPINYPAEFTQPATPPPPSIPRDEVSTWFEATIVDAAQRAIVGIDVVLSAAGEQKKERTNARGTVRFTDTRASVASLRVSSAKAAKEALVDRPPAAPSDPPDGTDTVRLLIGHDDLVAALHAEAPRVIVLAEPLPRVRLVGMHFDTNKSFMRPSALRGVSVVSSICEENPTETLLVVGHTDTTGEERYNLDLSLERARAVVAYLQKDVGAWEAWFDESNPYQKKWGDHEVALMISALPCPQTVAGFQTWSNETRGTLLEIDGVAGPLTRHALIAAYMDVEGDGAKDTNVEVHGCGEYFPGEATGDGVASEENRRVEIFCFEGPVKPPRPGDEATPGEPEYPQWRDSVTETIDVTAQPMVDVAVRLLDRDYSPMAGTACRATWGTKEQARGTSDGNGIADLMIPEGVESFVVEWGQPQDRNAVDFAYRRNVHRPKDEDEPALLQRLSNIGVRRDEDDAETSVRRYQRVRTKDETGNMDDIREELLAWHDDAVDPSRVPKAGG